MPKSAGPPANSVEIRSGAEWREWLRRHHGRGEGAWLVTHTKRPGAPYVSSAETVEQALCFGWVDSLPRRLDDARTMLWFAPRKVGTGWSRLNKERVARLIADGLMEPAGLAKVEAAKADGSWTKLDAVENLEIPADLTEAFQGHPESAEKFAVLPRSAKRGIFEWIAQARQAATRAKRIEETARLAGRNERANQWRKG